MSSYAHSSGVFHLPHLYSWRGMEIFNESQVQSPTTQQKRCLVSKPIRKLCKPRQNVPGIRYSNRRMEIRQDRRHGNLQIPRNFFAGQQQQNNFSPAASLQAAQPECHLTTGTEMLISRILNSIRMSHSMVGTSLRQHTDTPTPRVFNSTQTSSSMVGISPQQHTDMPTPRVLNLLRMPILFAHPAC